MTRTSIQLLALGGTIACETTSRGLVPRLGAEDLLVRLPATTTVDAVDFLDRTILFPEDWVALSTWIFDHLQRYQGFVVTLGTDSLAYLSSALVLMLAHLPVPVVLTGAMKPPGARQGDAGRNLSDALRVARARAGGVLVVFGGKIFDGSRVSKLRNDQGDAFDSINAAPLGTVCNGRVRWQSRPPVPRARPVLRSALDENVAVVRLVPQTTRDCLARFDEYAGLIVEGFGDGNLPMKLVPALTRLADRAVVVLASQCPYGPVSHRYEGGATAVRGKILSARDMTTEMAMVRLMWALGQSSSRGAARRLFSSPITQG